MAFHEALVVQDSDGKDQVVVTTQSKVSFDALLNSHIWPCTFADHWRPSGPPDQDPYHSAASALAAWCSTASFRGYVPGPTHKEPYRVGTSVMLANTHNVAVALAAWSTAAGKRAMEKMCVGCRKAPPPPWVTRCSGSNVWCSSRRLPHKCEMGKKCGWDAGRRLLNAACKPVM